jgi:radical SAM protein with 4Fe4S-binding SPASM domain
MTRRTLPSSLIFEVTSRCNFDCGHCYNIWKNPGGAPVDELPTAATIDLLDRFLSQTGARHVTLTGGEPLLRDDLPELVAFLNSKSIPVNIISNGSLLSSEKWQPLLSGKISLFELPLLSCERKIHDRMSGFSGAFDAVTEAIAALKLADARVVTVFVATRLNLPTWRETLELAFALSADGVMFNRFNPGGRGFQNLQELQASPEELQEALRVAESFGREYELPISASIAMPPCLFQLQEFSHVTFGFCGAGTERAYYTMDPVGNIRPCNHTSTILGNIREKTVQDMIDSGTMQNFMAACPDFCSGCGLKNVCLGGCKAAGEACYGDLRELEPFVRTFQHQAQKIPL